MQKKKLQLYSSHVRLFEDRTKELAVLLRQVSGRLGEDQAIVLADCFFNGIAGYYMSKKLFRNTHILAMDDEFYLSTFVDTLISGIEAEEELARKQTP